MIPADTHQQRAPADAWGDHDANQLRHHLYVVGLGWVMGAGLPPESSQHQRQSADGVTHQGHSQRGQAQSRKQHHKRHVHLPGVVEHVDKTPGARLLIRVRAQLKARQHGHTQSCQPDDGQADLGASFGDQGWVQQRLGDAQAPLCSHGTAHKERTQAKEHHAATQELAHIVSRVEVIALHTLRQVQPKNQSTRNHMAQEVCDHQGGGKQEERGLGAPALLGVLVDQDEEGYDVGDDAQRHGKNDHDGTAGGGLPWGESLLWWRPNSLAALRPPGTGIGETREERGRGGIVVAQC